VLTSFRGKGTVKVRVISRDGLFEGKERIGDLKGMGC
jgi:hypothetical protein